MAKLIALFESAALKLTLAYLLVIMLISITFSAIIYGISSAELGRELPTGGGRVMILNHDAYEAFRRERIADANSRLIANLVLLNLATLAIGGAAAYLLAQRTLQPIKRVMEEQSRFTGDASHELRTPLAAMRSEIEVALRDKQLKLTDAKKLLTSNLEEVVTLQGLSDRLLQLSGDDTLELTTTPLAAVVESAVARVTVAAEAKGVAITAVTATPVSVRADAERLTDLLAILCDNAVKYSESGGQVSVEVRSQGKFATVSVVDHGVGIRAADLPRVFDRFYRGDSARGRSGHGLGLSIAQRIAEQHQTKITVSSQVDKGSTFSVRLPLA